MKKTVFFLSTFLFFFATNCFAGIPLTSYCKDGYYQIPGEKKCSRAPKCGGKGYDELNIKDLMPNNNDCLDEGRGMIVGDPPNSSAFYGYVPLCCYEMERLKDPEMCIGYWERLWCHPDQCKAIDNNTGCGGGGCNCGHAIKTWCETRHCTLLPPVPIESRLGQKPPPTATPPRPTNTPVPTSPPFIPPTSIPTVYIPPTEYITPTLPFIPPTEPVRDFQIPTIQPYVTSSAPLPSSFPLFFPISLPSIHTEQIKQTARTTLYAVDGGLQKVGATIKQIQKFDATLESSFLGFLRPFFQKLGITI